MAGRLGAQPVITDGDIIKLGGRTYRAWLPHTCRR